VALLEDDSGMEVTLDISFLHSSTFNSQYITLYGNAVLMVFFFPLYQLLVNSKIISLDLPVKDVYKKIWCPEGEVCGYFPSERNYFLDYLPSESVSNFLITCFIFSGSG